MNMNNVAKDVVDDVYASIKEDKRTLFNYLYRNEFPKIKMYVLTNNGNTKDAEDIFQEIMMILLKKINQNDIDFSTISAFIQKVAKNLWLQTFRHEKPVSYAENMNILSENVSYETNQVLNTNKDEINCRVILKYIRMLDNDSKKLFMLYYNRYKAAKIASLMGYSGGENYVRKKIHICKSNLMQKIRSDPEFQGF